MILLLCRNFFWYNFPTKAYTVDSICAQKCQSSFSVGKRVTGDGKAGHKAMEVTGRGRMVWNLEGLMVRVILSRDAYIPPQSLHLQRVMAEDVRVSRDLKEHI